MSEFKDISVKNLNKSIERLTTLADYLRDNVKNKRFDFDSFLDHPETNLSGTEEEMKKAKKDLKEGFCGTTACAMGHACMMPEFQKKGLKVRVLQNGYYHNEKQLQCSYKDKEGNITTDFDAAAEFFKISLNRAEKLFSHEGYANAWGANVTKSQVVKAIRDYVYRANKHLAKRQVNMVISQNADF